jgi:hypothetical protein
MSQFPFSEDNLQETILDILLDNIEHPVSLTTIYDKLQNPDVKDEYGISTYFKNTRVLHHRQKILEKLYEACRSIDEAYDHVYRFYYYSKKDQNMVLIMSKKNRDQVKEILKSYVPNDKYFEDYMVGDYLNQVLDKRVSWYDSFDHTNSILGEPVKSWAGKYGLQNIFSSMFGDADSNSTESFIKKELENEKKKTIELEYKLQFTEQQLAKTRIDIDRIKYILEQNTSSTCESILYGAVVGILLYSIHQLGLIGMME